MAFAIHWKILFKSLRAGTVYTVNIYKDGTLPTGYPLTLKGGAQPFETQEDDDEDMFTPIRTQSGHIRIVDDGYAVNANGVTVQYNWKELLPSVDTDRPVTLTDGNGNVVWQGFMQAQNFTGVLYGNPQEREYPIQCPLSVLSATDVSTSERQLKDFGYVIKSAFDTIPSLTFSNFVFQGGADARQWLMTLVDWQNFVNSENDTSIVAMYDNFTIIEDICKLWGWSCRVHGNSVYFARVDDPDETKALVLTQSELGSLTDSTGTTTDDYLSTVTVSGDVFVSVNNEETQVRGYRKATVHANSGSGDTTMIETYPQAVETKIGNECQYYNVVYDTLPVTYLGSLTSATSAFMNFSARSGYGSFDYLTGNTEDGKPTGPCIRIRKSYSNDSADAYVTTNTIFEHSFHVSSTTGGGSGLFNRTFGLQLSGKILIKAEEYKNEETSIEGGYTMAMRVGIGSSRATAQWWDGNTWSDSETFFVVSIGRENDIFWSIGHNGRVTTALKSIRTTNQKGLLFVEFLGSATVPEFNGERCFDIMDFKVEFIYREEISRTTGAGISRADSYDYIASNTGNSRNDWDSDLIYATDNNYIGFGYGVPINTDGTRVDTVSYNGDDEIPEQNMADRAAAYWSASKRKILAELNSNVVGTVTPRNIMTFDGTTCHPISISREWRDDKLILTLMEV